MTNILIIGGSKGIGKGVVKKLSGDSVKIFATYNNTQIAPFNDTAEYHFLNVLEEKFDLSYLPDELDGLVYCPGSINLKPFARIKPEEFMEDYNLQVIGAVKVIQQVLPKLKKSKRASIVLYSTVAVQTGFNFHSVVAASKGAVEGLTKSLAAEFAPKIRVNCIAPSLTNTPLAEFLLNTQEKIDANSQKHPLKRIGTVDDIAELTTFLLSDKSDWITGQIFHVDGGISTIK